LFHISIQGAFGYFEVTDDITRYTKADVFTSLGKKTRIAVRFSVTAMENGGADTGR
jgi:catalase